MWERGVEAIHCCPVRPATQPYGSKAPGLIHRVRTARGSEASLDFGAQQMKRSICSVRMLCRDAAVACVPVVGRLDGDQLARDQEGCLTRLSFGLRASRSDRHDRPQFPAQKEPSFAYSDAGSAMDPSAASKSIRVVPTLVISLSSRAPGGRRQEAP